MTKFEGAPRSGVKVRWGGFRLRDVVSRLESPCFHYKVALHLSYLHIKFDDEIDSGSLDLGASSRIKIK